MGSPFSTIDDLCDRFELAWKSGRRPAIEEQLPHVPPDKRARLFSELLTLEIEYRRRRGEVVQAAEYLDRYPDYADLVQSLFANPERGHSTVVAEGTIPSNPSYGKAELAAEPQQIGRYRVCHELGTGSFGTVYLAEDSELGRHVAIKVPKFSGVDSSRAGPFLDEARKSAALKHPGIVTIYDSGHQDGQCYVVMEYVQGQPLDKAAQGEPLYRVIEWLAEAAEAIHYAHKRGLVHRDLKPANILIDDDGRAHVADFGLAVHELEQHGRAGEVSGTPAFMAPEQVRGEVHLLDGRADIWALGVVLYLMLTDRLPFYATDREELYEQIERRPPRPPRMIDDSVPAQLEQACLKCLAKPVEQRYSTAVDLARDLRTAADQLRVREHAPRPSSQLSRWALPTVLVIVVLIMAAVILNRPADDAFQQAETLVKLQLELPPDRRDMNVALNGLVALQHRLTPEQYTLLQGRVLDAWHTEIEDALDSGNFQQALTIGDLAKARQVGSHPLTATVAKIPSRWISTIRQLSHSGRHVQVLSSTRDLQQLNLPLSDAERQELLLLKALALSHEADVPVDELKSLMIQISELGPLSPEQRIDLNEVRGSLPTHSLPEAVQVLVTAIISFLEEEDAPLVVSLGNFQGPAMVREGPAKLRAALEQELIAREVKIVPFGTFLVAGAYQGQLRPEKDEVQVLVELNLLDALGERRRARCRIDLPFAEAQDFFNLPPQG